uniref:Secreted protein n=1 Tax=Oryza brachyantha TaxID=4533 RepID=J3M017_ORYBR
MPTQQRHQRPAVSVAATALWPVVALTTEPSGPDPCPEPESPVHPGGGGAARPLPVPSCPGGWPPCPSMPPAVRCGHSSELHQVYLN